MKTLLFLSAAGLAFILVASRKREPAYRFPRADFRKLCFEADPQMTTARFEWLWAGIRTPKPTRRSSTK